MEQFEIVTFYWVLQHMHISVHSIAFVDNVKKVRRFTHTYILNNSSVRPIRKTRSLFSFSAIWTSPPSIYMPDYSSHLQKLTPLWKLQKLLTWETSLGRHLNIFHHLEHDQRTVLLNPFAVAFLFLTSPSPSLCISLPVAPLHFSSSSTSFPIPALSLPKHLLACFLILSLLASDTFLVITIFGGHVPLSPTLLYNTSSNRLMAVDFLLLTQRSISTQKKTQTETTITKKT